MKPELLALCFSLPEPIPELTPAQLPEWLELVPAGEFTGRDGRTWINRNPHEVVARSSDIKIPVDIEHATEIKGQRGDEAPAYGWVEELRVTDSGTIEGRVVWSEYARWMLSERRYRYYSPAFFHDAEGVVTRLSSVGLTNKPNLDFPALNTEKNPMTVPVQITGLLGLAESATVDDTVAAIKQLQENEQVALNRAQTPDLTKFVPVETHNLALNRAETAEQRLQQLEEKEAEALVDAAIEAGKVAPANRDMFLATCRTEEGRKQFAEYTRGAQPLVNNDKPSQGKDKPAQTLTDAELAMCRSMGITGEEFLAAKPKQENN